MADACATRDLTHFVAHPHQTREDTVQPQPWGSVLRQTGTPENPTISRYIMYYAVQKYNELYNRQTQALAPGLSQVSVACVPTSQATKKYLGTIPCVRTRNTVSRRHPSDRDSLQDTRWAFLKPAIARQIAIMVSGQTKSDDCDSVDKKTLE